MFGDKKTLVPLTDYQITDLIPHREPFLFVDRIVSCEEKHSVCERTFTLENSWFFKGHFPQYPVVPGVLLVETMAQAGGAGLVAAGVYPTGLVFLLASIDNVKFRRQVRPNELLRMETTTKKASNRLVKQTGKAYVGDELAVEGEWVCILMEGASLPKE